MAELEQFHPKKWMHKNWFFTAKDDHEDLLFVVRFIYLPILEMFNSSSSAHFSPHLMHMKLCRLCCCFVVTNALDRK